MPACSRRAEDQWVRTPRFVLVGGGQAAAAAAEELRKREFDGEIVLLTNEREYPYERPPLSKEYLLSGNGDELLFKPCFWYYNDNL